MCYATLARISASWDETSGVRRQLLAPKPACSIAQYGPDGSFRVPEILEDRGSTGSSQLGDGKSAGRDADGARPDRSAALDVRRRITHHHDAIAAHIEPKYLPCTPLRERWQVRTRLVIGAKSTDPEAFKANACRAQFERRAVTQVSR